MTFVFELHLAIIKVNMNAKLKMIYEVFKTSHVNRHKDTDTENHISNPHHMEWVLKVAQVPKHFC